MNWRIIRTFLYTWHRRVHPIWTQLFRSPWETSGEQWIASLGIESIFWSLWG